MRKLLLTTALSLAALVATGYVARLTSDALSAPTIFRAPCQTDLECEAWERSR